MPKNRKDGKRSMPPTSIPQIDPRNEEQVRAYFARLEREYPELIEAMKVMNISYQQYLTAIKAMNQQSSISTSSTRLTL
ncbi:MAG: hypothetical protein ABSA41_08165 [Terriglobia bacterium]|jgi:predicted patatin/cPLA2 family phospholipase